ncbi:MAG: hypothetical protein JNL82_29925 [Myxococcales bacterium]|nr:hypothetical protein [Myxococcales bacterium]
MRTLPLVLLLSACGATPDDSTAGDSATELSTSSGSSGASSSGDSSSTGPFVCPACVADNDCPDLECSSDEDEYCCTIDGESCCAPPPGPCGGAGCPSGLTCTEFTTETINGPLVYGWTCTRACDFSSACFEWNLSCSHHGASADRCVETCFLDEHCPPGQVCRDVAGSDAGFCVFEP